MGRESERRVGEDHPRPWLGQTDLEKGAGGGRGRNVTPHGRSGEVGTGIATNL